MMYWIYDYPSLAIAVAFCTVFVALTWGGIFVTRATIHSWIHRDARANEMIGFALSSFFVLFGLLLGLIAVATYQNYANVGDIVDKEASSIGALYRDFTGYPRPIRGQLQVRLREYARYTIEGDCEDWSRAEVVVVRQVYRALKWQIRPAVALLQRYGALLTTFGVGHRPRILTDVSGPMFQAVIEIETDSLSDWETKRRLLFREPDFQAWFAQLRSQVEAGVHEFYRVEA